MIVELLHEQDVDDTATTAAVIDFPLDHTSNWVYSCEYWQAIVDRSHISVRADDIIYIIP